MSTRPDDELMAESIAEPDAFAVIYERHASDMFRFLARRIGPTDAELLLSELFMIAFEKRATFDPMRGELRGWLFGIGTNLLATYRRAQARRLQATARMWAGHPPPEAAEVLVDAMTAQTVLPQVAAAVAELPEEERATMLLYAWERLSYEEIAAALRVPIGTVRSRLNRARTRVRSACPTIDEGEWP